MSDRAASLRDRRLRQHLRPLRRDGQGLPERRDRRRDGHRPDAQRGVRRAVRRHRLPIPRGGARRSGGRRRRQPDLSRHPRRGDGGRARGRQARPQREADGEQLRGGTRPRRARRREGRAALVLADHVHGRRAGDRLEPDRLRRDRERPRRLRRGQLGPDRDLAPAARRRSTRSGRWRTSASTRSRS